MNRNVVPFDKILNEIQRYDGSETVTQAFRYMTMLEDLPVAIGLVPQQLQIKGRENASFNYAFRNIQESLSETPINLEKLQVAYIALEELYMTL